MKAFVRKRKWVVVAGLAFSAAFFFAVSATAANGVNFQQISGSDLGMGLGARAMGMSGAFTGLADDASAIYWNPAGLTLLKRSEASIMWNVDPIEHSFRTFVLKPKEWAESKFGWTVAYSKINRLKYIGEGAWGQGNAKQLVDMSMIYLPDVDTYTGGIDSRTVGKRVSVAGKIPNTPWSVGANFIDFKCTTRFFNSAKPRTCQIVAYKTVDFGFLYQRENNPRRRYGLSLRNPIEPSKPKYINVGMATFRDRDLWTLDVERIFGHYGGRVNSFGSKKSADFLLLRGGYERPLSNGFTARAGLFWPIVAKTSSLGSLRDDIPTPGIGGSVGLGYTWRDTSIDIAIFGDPGKSFVEEAAKPGFTLSLTQRF